MKRDVLRMGGVILCGSVIGCAALWMICGRVVVQEPERWPCRLEGGRFPCGDYPGHFHVDGRLRRPE